MPVTKPCAHCKGSGSEPDPITVAADRLQALISGATFPAAHGAIEMRGAVIDFSTACRDRIVALEGALSGLINCDEVIWPAGTEQVHMRVSREVHDRGLAVLDGTT